MSKKRKRIGPPGTGGSFNHKGRQGWFLKSSGEGYQDWTYYQDNKLMGTRKFWTK